MVSRTFRLQFLFQIVSTQFTTYGRPVDRQDSAKVGLNQRSHRVTAERARQLARGCADTTLETEGYSSGPRTDASFFDCAAPRIPDRCEHFLASRVPPANIIQIAIIRFAHQRID